MRERPILMSAPMVRASMRDVDPKTQTRRVIPASWLDANPETETGRAVLIASCRYGVVGDRLWIREAWAGLDELADGTSPDPPQTIGYRADHTAVVFGADLVPRPADTRHWNWEHSSVRWRPSIHMPRWASRLTLEITSVRVERVQSISPDDVIAEGVARVPRCGCEVCCRLGAGQWCPADAGAQVMEFAALWDSINGARPGCSWADDPWVFAIEFRRLPPGVESAARAQSGEGR